ncbi:MAG: hypothetical protein IJO65_02295 [Lachnospiraceae bacterium]|nr:hypothetical protein [Lachnospiraceae bacterium]
MVTEKLIYGRSTITYNWTEFEGEDLRKILADTILTINGRYSYHMGCEEVKALYPQAV